jgi:hypothetical protein
LHQRKRLADRDDRNGAQGRDALIDWLTIENIDLFLDLAQEWLRALYHYWHRWFTPRRCVSDPRLQDLIALGTSNKRQLRRLARKPNLATRLRQNNPTGKSLKTLSSPAAKNIPLSPSGKSVI